MSDFAVISEGLSKRYRLGTAAHHYGRLTESLSNALSAPFRRLLGERKESGLSHIWALKDVSFEVREGEAVGIIGRNGAGKSTLLKILSRITEPTEGRARLHGRVGALLEVGTGFHPELTGRENVYLNGATLGMTKSQIDMRFEEIVEFAEIKHFLDTPLKRYSSGMQVRLAFAVAAHLEPDVLVVDEVLAVGDARFQRRCLRRMGEVAGEGRTVLFVSHNMTTVASLCQHGIWLENGRIVSQGPMNEVVREYMGASGDEHAEFRAQTLENAPGNEVIRLRAVRLRDGSGRVVASVDARSSVYAEVEYAVLQPSRLLTGFNLVNAEGITLFTASDLDDKRRSREPREPGMYVSRWEIPPNLLRRGLYYMSVHSSVPGVKVNFKQDNAVSFSVDQSDLTIDGEGRPGVIAIEVSSEMERISELDGNPQEHFV